MSLITPTIDLELPQSPRFLDVTTPWHFPGFSLFFVCRIGFIVSMETPPIESQELMNVFVSRVYSSLTVVLPGSRGKVTSSP